MDKKQFNEFLESVAEIKELTPKKDPNIRLDEGIDDQVRVGDDWVKINAKMNPTLGYQFVRLKEQNRACELNCGKIVSNQVIQKKMYTYPKKHWRTHCLACRMVVSPDGKGFIPAGSTMNTAFTYYFRRQNVECAKTDPSKTYKIDSDGREYEEITTNDSVIRKYK